MRNLIKKILKESDWDWAKEIPGTKEYGQEYRYFEIIACYGVDWETEECDDEYSHFVVIPKHDVDEIWDIPDVDFDYLAGPGDEGLGVIEYAIENQLISPREVEEIVMFQGVREIDGEIARLRLGESKSINESDWDWLENTREHANYNGHPQGIVKLYNHDEIDRLCDVIDDYNGLPDTTTRHNLHRGLEFRRDELEQMSVEDGVDYGEAMLSVSFFVEKKNGPNSLTLGYWNYEVGEWDINEWLSYDYTYNKDYEMYDSIEQVENLFKNYQNPNLMKESDDDGLEWIRGAIDEYPIKLDQWYVMDFCTGFDKYQDELYRKVYELRTSTGEDFDLRRNNEVNWFNNGMIVYDHNYRVRLHFKFTISPVYNELRIQAGWDSCRFEYPYMDDYITITKDDFLNSYLDI
jgi:hypothetical protein